MNALMTVPKNGGLTRTTNSATHLPTWSSLLDDFFNRDLTSVFSQNFNTGISLPKVNIKETADAYFVEMAVPGLKKSDFQIDLENQLLSISTEVEEKSEEKEENYTRREFGYSSFKRSFTLPETVDEEKIKANYREGILSIHLPKKEEAKQKPPRNIKIS
ncbi:Hsp20/alpha crystallin family protein [Aequorivita vladivostokensis]|uniref:Heat-shock protein n=1 Tax=Aequorivita vladivostokensis TaxID=171194 RepID=A0ABR5DJ09_9FLAO|nr:Hsp20/alpha crystallin family protein [Aequorivita vladivostokensis]KJJ38768.1 heat-shock protein [Aequorivita vladivostokensis]|tara:strand:- start:278 stop:757 length:480 start_codon:yes stop_codon:yes gene_type:complete